MKALIQRFRILFDRTFAAQGWKQLAWLVAAILLVFIIGWLLHFLFISGATYNDLSGLSWQQRLFQLLIDPGAVDYVSADHHLVAQILALIGTILFGGCLISVISNMLQRHVENFKEGGISYQLKDHVVIIGFDDMVPSLIAQICRDPRYEGCHILVQTTEPAQTVKGYIDRNLPKKQEGRVLMANARRDSEEDLQRLYTTQAREVFVIGNRDEVDHDSMNIDCLKKIVEIHKRAKNCPIIPFTVFFAYHNTFSVFQVTDLAEEWRKYIEFRPFNFYEGWAKKVLISRFYTDGYTKTEYPALDREQMGPNSQKYVHLVILGMSRLGVALGTEAAHLMHFPNYFKDHSKKTRITFIDIHADREMDIFKNRYRHLFQIMSSTYRDFEDGKGEEQVLPPTLFTGKQADFLDIRFEFIKARAESVAIQKLLAKWAMDNDKLLTIAVCLKKPKMNMDIGLYLPDVVYERNTPILLQQQSSAALLSMLNCEWKEDKVSKFSHLFPFGMMDNYFDLNSREIQVAQTINYIYDYFFKHGSTPTELPDEKTMHDLWIQLPVALQWSNYYNSYSIGPKLRALGYAEDSCPEELSDEEVNVIAQVEHNRWCMEKLLLGFRKPDAETLHRMEKDAEFRKQCRQLFIHQDIRPYEDLSEDSKDLDRIMVHCLPLIIKQRKSTR
ncbi:MAG: hypothetical protein J6T82_04365 [Bacteroidaceae bacterium]|nr:hypothetical protein [Bacteroidaceae bacterium]